MKKYLAPLLLVFISFTIANVALTLNLRNQAETIKQTMNYMIMTQDFNNMKLVFAPLVKLSVNKISLLKDGLVIFEVSDNSETFNSIVKITKAPDLASNQQNYSIKILFKNIVFINYQIFGLILGLAASLLYYNWNIRIKHKLQVAQMLQSVAHDIRTPLSTLQILSSKFSDPEAREIQVSVINQINKIANDLLSYTKNTSAVSSEKSEATLVEKIEPSESADDFFKVLKSEYSMRNLALNNKVIFHKNTDLVNIQITKIGSEKLYRVINNCVQNAVEASKQGAPIDLYFSIESGFLEVKIVDTGKGIPDNILKKLGKSEVSHGKEISKSSTSGNGIAILNAFSEIKAISGKFSIQSIVGKGTTVKICIPLVS